MGISSLRVVTLLLLLVPRLVAADVALHQCTQYALESAVARAGAGETIRIWCAGSIELYSDFQVTKPGLTFDGSQAPGGGVQFTGGHTFRIRASDTTVRHLRFRPGPNASGQKKDALEVLPLFGATVSNVLIEHVSVQWATDGLLDIAGYYAGHVRNVVVRDSLFAEPLSGNAVLATGDVHGIRFERNLFAHSTNRNPQVSLGREAAGASTGPARVEIFDNVVGHHIFGTRLDAAPGWQLQAMVDGNHYLGGFAQQTSPKVPVEIHSANAGTVRVKLGNNIAPWRRLGDPECLVFQRGGNKPCAGHDPIPELVAEFETEPFSGMHMKAVLAEAGATQPCRDRVDRRIVQEMRDRTGVWPMTVEEVGGWPDLIQEGC